MGTILMKSTLFKDFGEFWSYTRPLSSEQRNTIFSSLPQKDQNKIKDSYDKGGWEDLFMRNKIDIVIDGIMKDFNIDLFMIKSRISKGKCYYMKKSQWEWINDIMSRYPEKHTKYVLGDIKVENIDENTVCLVKYK
jgi:hypothetical protein